MRRSTKQQLCILVFVACLIYGIYDLTAPPARPEHIGAAGNGGGAGRVDDMPDLPMIQAAQAAQEGARGARAAAAPPPKRADGAILPHEVVVAMRPTAKHDVVVPPPGVRQSPYIPRAPSPPDVRHPMCIPHLEEIRSGRMRLPNTSVIFCFCNEPTESL